MTDHTLVETAKIMNFSPAYVRALIRKGQLRSHFEPVVPDSLVKRHVVTDEDIAAYFKGTGHRTHRADGRNKYVIYLAPLEVEHITKLLNDNGYAAVVENLRLWNRLKPAEPMIVQREPRSFPNASKARPSGPRQQKKKVKAANDTESV